MFTCIGKRKGFRGVIVACTNTSEVPTRPDRPEWGFLCAECLRTRYGSQPLHVEVLDQDKPNTRELEPWEVENLTTEQIEQTEQEEWDALEELDIL